MTTTQRPKIQYNHCDRSGRLTGKTGADVFTVAYLTRVGRKWKHDLASDLFGSRYDAIQSALRIVNQGRDRREPDERSEGTGCATCDATGYVDRHPCPDCSKDLPW